MTITMDITRGDLIMIHNALLLAYGVIAVIDKDHNKDEKMRDLIKKVKTIIAQQEVENGI